MLNFVILAAGKSKRIYQKIKKNKCLLEIDGETIIEKIIQTILKIKKKKKIHIVTGFKKELIKKSLKNYKFINYIHNNKFETTEMLYSLCLALKKIKGDTIFLYSDILFTKQTILKIINNKSNSIIIPGYRKWVKVWSKRKKNILNDAETFKIDSRQNILEIGKKLTIKTLPKFQYMGIGFIPSSLKNKFLKNFYLNKKNNKFHITNFLDFLIKKKFKLKVLPDTTDWYEFDDFKDYLNYLKKNES